MRRIRIISLAVIFAIVGAILPMVFSSWLAWSYALKEEENTLKEYTKRMFLRAQNTFLVVQDMLSTLQKLKIDSVCSNNHIKNMRDLSLLRLEDELIAYFDNNIQQCNSYGISSKTKRERADVILSNNLELVLNTNPFPETNLHLMGLRKLSNYEIYIRPEILTSIMIPDSIHLAIIYHNMVLSEKNRPDYAEIMKILEAQHLDKGLTFIENQDYAQQILLNKTQLNNKVFIIDQNLVSLSQYGPFFFVATESITNVYNKFKRLQIIILPFGFITALFIMALVIYFSRRQLSFRAELQIAVSNHEFIVHYQPIINIENGTCCGAEALIRWLNNTGQVIKPDLFIPYAEEIGLIPQITDEVIEIVFNDMGNFLKNNPAIHISINVSSQDIQSGRILDVLDKKFEASSMERSQLWIEISERAFVDVDISNKTLNEARSKGHEILVDDFGTGYSSLSYLQNLEIDTLKIDKSFIDSMGTLSATSNVTDHIISIAKELNLKLIAEGVETKLQLEQLKEYQVEYVQGYIFSRTLEAKEFIQFCTNFNKKTPNL